MISPQCELSIPSVCPHMTLKMTTVQENLVTLVALIWFIPSVCPHMPYKNNYSGRNPSHIGCIDMVSPQCEFYDGFQYFVLL